ncbi:MAG: hypothetical protein AB1631_27655 [Acidobacteriota bacterium]
MAKRIEKRNEITRVTIGSFNPDELKSFVRDGLMAMSQAEREEFIQTLQAEVREANIRLSSYLVPLGIPGRSPNDLTPTEVGHLVRYLKINAPQAMPGIERALARYPLFMSKLGESAQRLAA